MRHEAERTWDYHGAELGDCPCCFAWNPGNRGTVPMFAVSAYQKTRDCPRVCGVCLPEETSDCPHVRGVR